MKLKNIKLKKQTILMMISAVLLLTSLTAFMLRPQETSSAAITEEALPVESRTSRSTVTATGHVQAAQRATLAFPVSGRVVDVPVQVGDLVQAGNVLGAVDLTEQKIRLAQAEQTLVIEEARLAELKRGATDHELEAAAAAVVSAEAHLAQLQTGPRPAEITLRNAELSVSTAGTAAAAASLQQVNNSTTADQIAAARAELATAQGALEQARQINNDWKDEETHRALTQAEERVAIAQQRLDKLLSGPDQYDQGEAQAQLASAAAQEEAARLEADVYLRGGSPEQIQDAQAQLAQAQSALDRLERGASAEQLRMAEATVSQAQLSVDAAREAVDKAILRAPFSGVVTAVHVAEGDQANGPVIEMMNPDSLEVVLRVSEIDIGRLEMGQSAIIHTETWPAERLETHISNLAPGVINGDSRVNYEIRLPLPQSENPIRVGMTVVGEVNVGE
ncbi:MAG: HlyD family efflux transporter periplasmic adaptor subunit [Ardenticatenaceae bacterium]|nr:HlyD family efflux transporter periplasmic adaptor subunit [Ardenticatenaceae bacterium]